MGWLWVARPRVCGACPSWAPIEDRTIPEGDLAYITKTGLVRCRDCWEAALGVCQLSYDAEPHERLDHHPAAPPPAPTLYELPASTRQPVVTSAELARLNAIRARAIARWKERRRR